MTLCAGVAGYALYGYATGTRRMPVHPDMQRVFAERRFWITLHAVGGSLALLAGPFQFLRSPTRGRWHRGLGYVYLTGVLAGGVSGLALAPTAFGGPVSHLGFGTLAALWLATGALAWRRAVARDFDAHRRWMVRNFALSLAAVTLRFLLPGSMAAGVPFELAYPAIAWLCWVPNLLVAEWRYVRPAPAVKPA